MFFLVFPGFRIPEGSSSDWGGSVKTSIFIPTTDDITAPELARLFIIHVFSKHGVLAHVTCDQGSEFVSHFFRSLGTTLDMKIHFTSGYHLEGDGHDDDPSGILNPGKIRKNIHTGFFKPHNFPKGYGHTSNNYIQHIYSYSTFSNYPNTQHSRGNKFANTIGMHQ